MDAIYFKALNQWQKKWFQYVADNPEKPWSYYKLSLNPNVTWEIVCAHPEKPWRYDCLSRNPNITWEIVCANPEMPWVYTWLTQNPNITWEIICAHPEIPWSYCCLSKNPNITWEFVCAHPEIPWSYYQLSMNPNITWEIVNANPDKPWGYGWVEDTNYFIENPDPGMRWDCDFTECVNKCLNETLTKLCCFSLNQNITWEIVHSHPDAQWNYNQLSANEMTFAREDYIQKTLQEWFQKSALKEELMASVWHPRHFHKFHWMDPDTFDLLEE